MSKSEISKEKPENSKIFTIIESLCKEAGVSVTRVCTDITGNKGNLPTWKKGNINTTSLIKLTEYFDVSADYLLGRTANPVLPVGNNISGNSNNGDNNISVEANFKETQDNLMSEFLKRFEKLDFDDKLEIMNLTAQKLKRSA